MVGYGTTPSRHSKFNTSSGKQRIFNDHIDTRPRCDNGGGGVSTSGDVGVPQEVPTNAFTALDDGSLVRTPERHGDELRPVAGSVAADSESI